MSDAPVALTAPASRVTLLLRNSFANVLRAGSTSLVTILMPLVLVVVMPVADYAAWALIFSLASYALYLDLGMQSTVQALVGRSDGSIDTANAVKVAASALRVISFVMVLCLAGGLVLAAFLSQVFPDIPDRLQGESKIALVIAIVGQGSSLAGSTIAAYFAGKQRSMEATAVIAPARLLSMVGAISAALLGGDLIAIAISYAAPLVVGSVVLVVRFLLEARRLRRVEPPRQPGWDSGATVFALLRYSGPLIIWNVCLLFVTGVGLTLVGRLDYSSVAIYSIAAMIASGLGGIDSALISPLLPELGRRQTAGDSREAFSRVVVKATLLNSGFLFLVTVGILAYSPWLVKLLYQGDDDGQIFVIVALVLCANAFRLAMTPVTLAFLATKTHSRIVLPPVVEAVVNVTASVALGLALGAVGVAIGGVIGSLVAVLLASTWSLRKSGAVAISSRQLWASALGKPFLTVLPGVAAIALVQATGISSEWLGFAVVTVGIIASGVLVLKVALTPRVRGMILSRIGRGGA